MSREHELDDDSVNALNARVADMRRENAVPDDELPLRVTDQDPEKWLNAAAITMRTYEALRKAGR